MVSKWVLNHTRKYPSTTPDEPCSGDTRTISGAAGVIGEPEATRQFR
jgi:hypothetical protein